jgi:hypothetical protein
MLNLRKLATPAVLVLVLGSAAAFANPARAGNDIDSNAMKRAMDFVAPEQRGRDILSYIHYGAKYRGHSYQQWLTVVDQQGKTIPGHFALDYRFKWDDDGVTDVRFFFDAKGNVYEVQIVKHNAVLQQPYFAANLAIKILGNLLIEALKDNLTPEQLKDVQKFVDNADAKGLLEWSLKVQQAAGK